MKLVALLAILLLMCGGCRTTVVSVTKPDGTLIKVENYSFGNEAKIDELTIPTDKGPATLKGGSSNIGSAINDTAATLRNLSEKALVP